VDHDKETLRSGIVTSRRCPECGHHELGITTKEGDFHPLRPGNLVQILEENPEPFFENGKEAPAKSPEPDEPSSTESYWIPEPVKGDHDMRLKYGVMIKDELKPKEMTGELYQEAYMEKLRRLIEKEVNIPVAVILDKIFTSPHLASGNPKEVVFAMWKELDEIREPVKRVKAWLVDPNEKNLNHLIRPKSLSDLTSHPFTETEMEEELAQMTLEDFLSLL
jgi:hypothetical protein